MKQVRVRIAPSPTGFAHIGTAYMGLFNWAFAKKHNGNFILRIEDTDQKRHVPEAEQAIFDALEWLDLVPDESPIKPGKYGPYRQSERLDLYRTKAKELIGNKKAYEKEGATWLSMPKSGAFGWDDAVRGHIEFSVDDLKDWVILKSDGFPTYNFAAAVDDASMDISHVLRGEEHISNTPLQLHVSQALGLTPPIFGHLPVLRNADHKKLSKRRDPVSLQWFREQGYLGEAMLNFLALQGWSHPQGKDVFPISEFVREITLERIKTSAPVFDFKKLDWLNGEYIRQKSTAELIKLVKGFSKLNIPDHLWEKIIPLVKERMKKLSDIDNWTSFFVQEPATMTSAYDSQSAKQLTKIESVLKKSDWSIESIQHDLLQLVDNTPEWKRGPFFMNLRLAITGQQVSPPLIESMEILGRDECLKRLNAAIVLCHPE